MMVSVAVQYDASDSAVNSEDFRALLWRLYIGFSCENSQLPLPITQPMPLAIHP